jgi:Flp pilus assembly protein TadD
MELAPNDSDIRANLGLMLARQGKLSEATAQLNEALRLNPKSAEAHNNLGLVFLMAGQPEKSLSHFSTALDLRPNFTVALDNLRRAQSQIDARKK